MFSRSGKRKYQRGLSLLEMLIYIAISGGVIIVLAQVMATLSRIAGTSQSRAEVRQNIAVINQKMNEKIQSASAVGKPAWISYFDTTVGSLNAAMYVEVGGTGCGGSVTKWSCEVIDNVAQTVGRYNSIAFDSAGTAWISYEDSNGNLKVAKYVGSGGTGCSITTWTCTVVEDTASLVGAYTSIAFDLSGKPWISYVDDTAHSLKVANYVGSSGNCTSAAWNCTTVDDPANWIQYKTAIAFDSSGSAWVSYYDSIAGALKVANYVGSGGSCTSTAWNCVTADDSADVGSDNSVAFDGSGNAWISYYDLTAQALRVANYVGSGGSCTSTAWNCVAVEDTANIEGNYSSIAFDPSGSAWVGYQGTNQTVLKVAKYVSSGGTGCTSSAWTCTTVDDPANSVGSYVSIAVDTFGNPQLSYYDSTAQILKSAGYVGSGGNCTSTAWNCSTVDDPTDNVGLHTDIAIRPSFNSDVLDMRISGSNHRFNVESYGLRYVLAGCAGNISWSCTTLDNDTDHTGLYSSLAFDSSGAAWVSYFDNTATALMVAKYVGTGGTGCGASGSTAWTCTTVDNDTDNTGQYASLDFDTAGTAWTSYYQGYVDAGCSTVGECALMVAKYVGTGGTGCGASGSSAWTCTTVDDDTDDTGQYSSLAFSPSGVPWISYHEINLGSLVVAKYVGAGGTGCGASGSSAWTCTTVDDDNTDGTGQQNSISFDSFGNPWISYQDTTAWALMVAKYVGTGGTGCGASGSTAWTCIIVVNDNNFHGFSTSLVFDEADNISISYHDNTATSLVFVTLGSAITSANIKIEKCQGESYYFSVIRNAGSTKDSVRYCFKASYDDQGDNTRKTSQEVRSTVTLR